MKARPETTKTVPRMSTARLIWPVPIALKTSLISSEPVAPYIIDSPYSRKPLASAPSTKYFIAASVAGAWSRRIAVSA